MYTLKDKIAGLVISDNKIYILYGDSIHDETKAIQLIINGAYCSD